MPKAPAFTPKAPVEKLPLAVRKAVRDDYEAKRADYETEISDLLGFPMKININVNAVWAYAENLSTTQAGSTLAGYVDGFIDALKRYVNKFGDLGKEYFKKAVVNSELTLTVNVAGDNADTISADIKDGVFRILFHQDKLGYNQSYLEEFFVIAIDQAPHEGFGLLAKHSIAKDYEDEIDEVREEIAEILALPGIVLDANFEENYAKLLKKEDQSWQKNFGETTLSYFKDGFKYQITRQGFKGDDMLQEGFVEIITTKTVKLRLVEEFKTGYYNEAAIEDGTLYLQTKIDTWTYNISDLGSGIIDLL